MTTESLHYQRCSLRCLCCASSTNKFTSKTATIAASYCAAESRACMSLAAFTSAGRFAAFAQRPL